MKRFAGLRALLLWAIFVSSPTSGYARDNRLVYYDLINEAELDLVSQNRKAAIIKYRNAFSLTDRQPFTKDLLNAYYCAIDLKSYAEAKVYLQKILARGINSRIVAQGVNSRSMGSLFGPSKDPAISDMVKSWIASLPNDTLKSDPLCSRIRDLDQSAQLINRRLLNPKLSKDSMVVLRGIIKGNADQLFLLFKTYGVPGEDRVGNISGNPLLPPLYNNVLVQYFKYINKPLDRNGLDTMIYKAILRASIIPLILPICFMNLFIESAK